MLQHQILEFEENCTELLDGEILEIFYYIIILLFDYNGLTRPDAFS